MSRNCVVSVHSSGWPPAATLHPSGRFTTSCQAEGVQSRSIKNSSEIEYEPDASVIAGVDVIGMGVDHQSAGVAIGAVDAAENVSARILPHVIEMEAGHFSRNQRGDIRLLA